MSIRPVSLVSASEALGSQVLSSAMLNWIAEGSQDQRAHRQQLVDAVDQFLLSRSNRLAIVDLDIDSLPEFLCHPLITRQLRELSITRTLLEELPEWMSQLGQLETLVLEDNFHIDSLPDSFGDLAQLRRLDISYISIADELKDVQFPASMRDLRLEHLSVAGIPGGQIGPWLDSQVNLRQVILNNCDYFVIPDQIFELQQLRQLVLIGNNIDTIDDRIELLTHLEILDLSDNAITRVNQGIFNLDGGCEINLSQNALSAREIARIDSIIEDDAYRGPSFTTDNEPYVSSEEDSSDEELSLEEVLISFYRDLHQPRPRCLDALIQDETLSPAIKSLIKRLKQNIEPSHPIAAQAFGSLGKSLVLAALNPEFRQGFFELVDGATRTCGDGIIAIILKLGLLRQELLLDLDKPTAVLEFILKGKLAMSILESSASLLIQERTHAISQRMRQAHPLMPESELSELIMARVADEIDPVEVYLIYPIELRNRLDLPLEVDDMFFRPASRVARKDLDIAAENVERTLANRASVVDFLVEDVLWLKLLERAFPSVFAELAQKQEQLADLDLASGAQEDPYVAFAKEKKHTLQEMTEKLLCRLQNQPPLDQDQHLAKRARAEKGD